MFRSISSRRLSPAPRSLLALSTSRSFSNNARQNLQIPALRPYTRSSYRPRPLLVSKSLFSPTHSRSISDAEKTGNLEEERKRALKKKLEADPENVTSTSSMTPIFDPKPKRPAAANNDDPDMLRGLKSDLRTIKETFELHEVPKEVLYIGMSGLIPYLGTSLSTLYLAWDLNYSAEHGLGFLVSSDTAEHLLHLLEPFQVGLGAIILSFLGAVHWGLEMAEYGGKHTYKRYSLSILAPMIAWPTLLLPIDYALLAQFVGFTGMYFADATATSKGWAPRWYMTYRFLLTFVVGASIVMTLIGRGQIGDRISKIPGPASYLQDLRDSQRENLQKEEDERRRELRKEEAEQRKATKKQAAQPDSEEDENDKSEDGKGSNSEEEEEKEGKSNKTAADPGKRAKGDQPGTQGVYPDEKQGSGGSSHEYPEPTGEKQNVQKPRQEGKDKNPKPRG